MKRLINILFYVFYTYLLLAPIWYQSNIIENIFIITFLVLSVLIAIKTDKSKFKIDILDLLLGLLPIGYLIPHIFGNSVFTISDNIHFIIYEFTITTVLLILRRNFTKNRINSLLTTLPIMGVIYFLMSFVAAIVPTLFNNIGIYSTFGDTYINSIYRFYGTLYYCNTSAVIFLIGTYTSLFKCISDKENKHLFRSSLFVNFVGFLITFSKMLTIAFILVIITLVILKIIMKKKDFLYKLYINLISLVVPSMLAVKLLRDFIGNLNIIYFFVMFEVLMLIYLGTCIVLEYLDKKWKYSSCFYMGTVVSGIFLLTINPISMPVAINKVLLKNGYIISDFILEENKEYSIKFNVTGKSNGTVFQLVKLYVGKQNEPLTQIVQEIEPKEENMISFKTGDDFEYYFLRAVDINTKTNIKISDVEINDKDYLINSMLIPYQFIHQLMLTKYDQESVSHRFWYYKDSLKILSEQYYLFGQGRNTFRYYSFKIQDKYVETNPHSLLFQLWLDIGIYGVIYILGLIILGIMYMFKYKFKEDRHVWFCIFCTCMIVVPFDAVFTLIYVKSLLVLSFILTCYKNKKI